MLAFGELSGIYEICNFPTNYLVFNYLTPNWKLDTLRTMVCKQGLINQTLYAFIFKILLRQWRLHLAP